MRALVKTASLASAAPELNPLWEHVTLRSFRRENTIVSILSNELNGVNPYEKEAGFDFQAAAKAAGHDDYLDRYVVLAQPTSPWASRIGRGARAIQPPKAGVLGSRTPNKDAGCEPRRMFKRQRLRPIDEKCRPKRSPD